MQVVAECVDVVQRNVGDGVESLQEFRRSMLAAFSIGEVSVANRKGAACDKTGPPA